MSANYLIREYDALTKMINELPKGYIKDACSLLQDAFYEQIGFNNIKACQLKNVIKFILNNEGIQ
jgi:hypothetical protein